MAERGTRSKLVVGGVAAEVALIKTSAKPREAQHETRRVVEGEAQHQARSAWDDVGIGADAPDREDVGDPLAPEPEPEAPTGGFEPLATEPTAADPPPAPEPDARIEHGVTGPGGVWVDLTAELDEIDARTKLEAMTVEATVARNAVPAHRVRDSHYVAPAGEGAPKVLALLWQALRNTNRAALVRWTKRTNQALGALVAAGSATRPHLVLLEVEWQANVRELPRRAELLPAMAGVTAAETDAACDLVVAWSEPPAVFEDLRDERASQRAELLERAREDGEVREVEQRVAVVPAQAAALRDALAA